MACSNNTIVPSGTQVCVTGMLSSTMDSSNTTNNFCSLQLNCFMYIWFNGSIITA